MDALRFTSSIFCVRFFFLVSFHNLFQNPFLKSDLNTSVSMFIQSSLIPMQSFLNLPDYQHYEGILKNTYFRFLPETSPIKIFRGTA